MPNKKTVIEKL